MSYALNAIYNLNRLSRMWHGLTKDGMSWKFWGQPGVLVWQSNASSFYPSFACFGDTWKTDFCTNLYASCLSEQPISSVITRIIHRLLDQCTAYWVSSAAFFVYKFYEVAIQLNSSCHLCHHPDKSSWVPTRVLDSGNVIGRGWINL